MGGKDEYENRAAMEFLQQEQQLDEIHKDKFVNMRETLLDVLIYMEEYGGGKVVKKLKTRVLDSRSCEELKVISDGLKAVQNFTPVETSENEEHSDQGE